MRQTKRSAAATAFRPMRRGKSAAIASDDRACAKRGCLAADAHAPAPIAARAISRAHQRGAVVAVWPMPSNHPRHVVQRTRMIATAAQAAALASETWMAERPRTISPEAITFIDRLRSSNLGRLAGARRLSGEAGAGQAGKAGISYFPPACALAIASLQPSLRSAACDFRHSVPCRAQRRRRASWRPPCRPCQPRPRG